MTHRIKPSDSTNDTDIQNKMHENNVFAMIGVLPSSVLSQTTAVRLLFLSAT